MRIPRTSRALPRGIRRHLRQHSLRGRRLLFEPLEDRRLLSYSPDRWEDNPDLGRAAEIGVGPGVHLSGLTVHDAADHDWYRFEVLRADVLRIALAFEPAAGALAVDLTDAEGNLLASGTPQATGTEIDALPLVPGTYHVHVAGVDGASNEYALSLDPGATSATRLFYVNDASTVGDLYTLAAGNDANDGLTPGTPKATVQAVLSAYDLGPGDLVLIDTGTYGGLPVVITAVDEGAAYAGSPAGSEFNYGGTRWELNDADFNLLYGLTFAGSGGTGIHVRPGTVDPSSHNELRGNRISGTSTGIRVDGGTGNLVSGNVFSGGGRTYGVYAAGYPGLMIEANDVAGAGHGIYVASGSVTVRGNELHHSTIGLGSYVENTLVFGNAVHDNTIGLEGYGTFGGSDWSEGQPNDVWANGTGISIKGGSTIRFNRIHANATGIRAEVSSQIHHNLIYRNTSHGILLSKDGNFTLANNTIYAPSGEGVRLQNGVSNVRLRNNIVWADSGCGVYVATDSQQGFSSDYNNLYTAAGATLVWWQKPFTDLFDWQVEADFDTHSIGYTAVDSSQDDPRFVDLAGDDYQLSPAVSTSIDAGDPASPFGLEPEPAGGRINLGAYGGTTRAAVSRPQYIQMDYPDYYVDWPDAVGRAILWRTYDAGTPDRQLAGSVSLDLYQAGVGHVTQIAVVPAADGSYGWTPQVSGITPSTTARYWIRVSSVVSPTIFDESRERFAVPLAGQDYYVNDGSTVDDQYSTAAGDNRHTGKTPGDPKANLLPLLRAYDLGPDDVVHVDAGEYIHVRNVVLSGDPMLGDDEGLRITGPTDPAKVARIDRGNTAGGAAGIELNQADYVTLEHLTLVGGRLGVWVRNNSTHFYGRQLVLSDNSQDGIRLESNLEGSRLENLTACHNGGTGIWVSNSGAGTPVVVGAEDLSRAAGNRVYENGTTGIYANSEFNDLNVLVVGNTVWGHASPGAKGIAFARRVSVSRNVVYDNTAGISGWYGAVESNRVYRNGTGIYLSMMGTVRDNVVYSNSTGIQVSWGDDNAIPQIVNNVVYGNTDRAILVTDSRGTAVLNNTVYQPSGDGVRIEGSNTDAVTLRNNIVWVQAGSAISVANESQRGFVSDYNLLYATGGGSIAWWQGAARTTLAAWQNTALTDANSLSQDPLFVNPVGADGHLGWFDAAHDGRDDDFHLQSAEGSYHGGSPAPALDAITGLPIHLTGTWTTDADQSPGIDRGHAGDAYAEEPLPNGGYINLGAYGNTAQASKSPAQYVLVTRPDGGEVWPAEQTFAIRWRSHSLGGSAVDLDLMKEGQSEPVAGISAGTENDGEFLWTIPDSIPPAADYRVRVTRTDVPALSDQSNQVFEIAAPVHVYYVNDVDPLILPGDWTTAPGNDVNDGLTPATPKASIAGILAAYDLGPGDVIKVDHGTYNLAANVAIAADDSGVRIEGYYDPADPTRRALLDRGNKNSGSYGIELTGGDQVTVAHLHVTGAYDGVYAGSGSEDVTISGCTLYGNARSGIYLTGAARAWALGNEVYQNAVYGVYAAGTGITVEANLVYQHFDSGSASGSRGIYLGNGALAKNNIVHDNTTGIEVWGSSTAEGNRVYHHRVTGISVWDQGTVRGNMVYSNPVGILGQESDLAAQIVNNLVYGNTNRGILISETYGTYGSGTASLVNNTVYQPVGDAVRVEKSPNVQLRNNILWAQSGYNLYVAANSQAGFSSDYNDLVTTGTGKLASWQGRDFTSLVDWWYEVGQDEHGRAADPLFLDRDGGDDILGFSTEPLEGTARIVDDGDPEFSLVGSWTAKSSGYQGDSYETVGVMGMGNNKATWTLDVTPVAWYEVAVTWPQRSGLTGRAPYVLTDGNAWIDTANVAQQVTPADFVDAGVGWKRLGYYYVRSDQLTIQLSDKQNPGGPVVADAVRVQRIAGDHGGDDDFRVPAGSPTVDAGHPADAYLAEPYPHGNRINLGHTGNTPQAAGSPSQLVQMLTPNGREKYEVGQPVTLQWRSAGLTLTEIAALINTGGGAVDLWSAHGYQTLSYANGSFTSAVDTGGVADPAPASVYQTYAYAAWGVGNRIAWQLPVRDGSYQLRLHFAEPTYTSSNQRKFDVVLQGAVVQTDYDIFATAGARYKATVVDLPVIATHGGGITLELANKTFYPALLSGIELTASNPLGDPAPTVNIELSVDGGYTYSPLAADLPLDRYGRGSYVWTAGPETSDNTALIRVTANQGSQPQDTSDEPFLIANDGPDYYVNDASVEGDVFTTAVGDNTASGKRPDQPMASLAALLSAYDLDPGDLIHVDTGQYFPVRNIVLGSQDSGVRIEGPSLAGRTAVLDRGNSSAGSYVIEAAGGDGVTVDHLHLTGGYYGVYAAAASDDLTISGCEVYANASTGIYLDAAPRAQAVGNEVRDNAVTGIYAAGTALSAADGIVVQANHVYRHLDSGDRGILIGSGAIALENVAHDNRTGIEVTDAGTAESNRVYYNTGTGIALAGNGTARGNTSYSNSVGIWAQGPNLAGQILHNLVYANTNQGIRLTGAYYDSGASVVNNTVYQPVGDAVRVESLPGVQLRNNVLGVEAGYAMYVDANSQSGFSSDYNQLYATGTGQLASWQGRDFATLADWGYETGQDQHSRIADPQWVDRDGADDRLGFRHTLLDGTVRIVDDGDPGFSVTEGWTTVTSGYEGDSREILVSVADAVAAWTMSGLEQDAWYEVAITWPSRGTLTRDAPYTLLDGSTPIAGLTVNQRTAPADFTEAGVGWKRLGYYYLQSGQLTLRLSSPTVLFDFVVADAVRVQRIAGDHGADDDFRVSAASPTIDAGHPGDDYLAEPQPNGGRINLGHTGNTAEAAASPAESLQLLTPNGGEKFELGQLVPISWHTAGVMPADGSGDPIPTADLELSADGGISYSLLAMDLPLDHDGRGTFLWTAGPETSGNTALLRVKVQGSTLLQDISDAPFLITNNGPDYYVNDASTVGDVFTTATGDNAAGGKRPDQPMANLAALLAAYDLEPGDVVHVDHGQYALLRNVVLAAEDSGVRITGPAGSSPAAVLHRGNQVSGSYAVELAGADGVTLEHLRLSGAYHGVYAASGSEDLLVSHCVLDGHAHSGIYLSDAARARVADSELADNTQHGVYADGSGLAAASGLVVENNRVRNNGSRGVTAVGSVLVQGNEVSGHSGSGDEGINLSSQATARDNVVHGNTTGIEISSGLAEGNRVYNNTGPGILVGFYSGTIRGNWVYSNAVGIWGQGSWLNAKIENNLIYANANRGIYISGATSANGTRIVNNTVYQPVGDAVRVEGSENVFLRNNILWVGAGYGLYVTSNSQSGLSSDYNLLYQGVDPNAHAGYWNSAVRDSLADWQSVSAQDAHSLDGDPLFVDRDGADNVLGYTTAGGGHDGGRDDNFYPAALSPAIDRASSWDAPLTDLPGNPRMDDPGTPNAGSNEYFEGPATAVAFPPSPSSMAMNWRWDDRSWNLTLPFSFPFFGQTYSLAFVSSNGLIQFGDGSSVSDPANSTDKLDDYVRIAPLWDDLRTNGTGDDIFVDTSVAGQVIIRWDATNKADGSDVNVAAVLFSDGRIQFEYGAGNHNLTPTVGLSQGGGKPVRLSLYDGATELENAAPRAFVLAPGDADIGAFEFLGSSADVTAPRIINVLPAGIAAGGDVPAFAGPLVVAFSEELNPIDAQAPANYELRRAVNEVFGDADDVVYALDPDYVFTPDTGASIATLTLAGLGGESLPLDSYRLTVRGGTDAALHDTSGNRLDGDDDGLPGPDYVRTFEVVSPTLIVTALAPHSAGFVAEFNRPLDLGVLNLYDGAQGGLGPADVVLRNGAGAAVAGSIVTDASGRKITFVGTGNPLAPDDYTVTLRSGASAFRDPAGNELDGDRDGIPGDDFTAQFTVAATASRIVSLPDMARGAGQPVNVPNAAAGLPIRLDNADSVTSLAADLIYDQTLLTITAAASAAGLPGDWSVVLDTSTPGVAKIAAAGTTALSGTDVEVVRLTATVPNDAPYGASQTIRLQNVSLNGGALAAVGDVAVHKAAYLGDADGSGIHSSADAFLTVQAALGLATGFSAHAWTDPLIVADADGSGVLSAADAFLIVQEGLGLVEPFVPDNPHITVTPVGGGIDPQFQIDENLLPSAGGWVSVPVNLDIEPAATNVGAIDFDLFFEPSRLTIQLPGGVLAGADTAGWAVSATLMAPGQLRVGMASSRGQPLTPGLREIARLRFHVAASLRDAGPLAKRAAYGDPNLVSERPGYVVALDIEPADPHSGGYTWTAVDGSVAVVPGQPRAAVDERPRAEALRDQIFGEGQTEFSPLENLLTDLADDLDAAWRSAIGLPSVRFQSVLIN